MPDSDPFTDTVDSEPDLTNLSMWRGWTRPPKYKGWVVDELTDSLCGPFVHEDVTALTSVKNSPDLVAVTRDYAVKKTDLTDMRESNFAAVTNPWTDTTTLPASGTYVVGNERGAFAYRGRYLTSPFADSETGVSSVMDPIFFPNAYLSIAETAWMHLGNEHNEKQVHRVDLAFRKNSFGHLWLYVESDEGKVSGQYKGALQEHVKVFTNLRGRRFRVRMFVATHNDYPWNLREMAVGHLVGKSF